MTHIAHPYGLRLGILTDWQSRWFDKRGYRGLLRQDVLLRRYLWKELKTIFVDTIEIERSPHAVHVIIKTSQPGLLIGRGGEGATRVKEKIRIFLDALAYKPVTAGVIPASGSRTGGTSAKPEIKLTIEEVRMPETHAHILAQMIARDLERRLPFRRVLKGALEKASANKEVQGVKIAIKGRLDGAEMGRYEWLRKGRIPLQTLRANVDYAQGEAQLPYGKIGIKTWIYKGEVFSKKQEE